MKEEECSVGWTSLPSVRENWRVEFNANERDNKQNSEQPELVVETSDSDERTGARIDSKGHTLSPHSTQQQQQCNDKVISNMNLARVERRQTLHIYSPDFSKLRD